MTGYDPGRRTTRLKKAVRSVFRVGVGVSLCTAMLAAVPGGPAQAATAPVGNGFTVTAGDLSFILKQIKIAEHHAATLTPADPCGTLVGPGKWQIPDRLTAYGLRTVDGSCNNLFPGRENFAAADQPFPRLTNPVFKAAEGRPANFFGPGDPGSSSSSYAQKKGSVYDSQPRTISNLINDQTSTNPAAIAAAAFPVRSQGNPGLFACTTDPDPLAVPPVEGVPANCVPSHQTLFIPNVTTDTGLSPPYNSLFTFFGQFFDHGVDQTVKGGGTVFVPLKADDPLRTLGPDGKPNTGDEVPASQAFMVLTRAQNQPGPDGILGDDPSTPNVDESADDIQNANNTDTPWVDQSQTYTSHASHQVFLREYSMAAGKPVATGKLLGGEAAGAIYPGSPDGTTGMATWHSIKAQAASKLGLLLQDQDVTNIPMLATDPYGEFIPGANGLPQYVTKTGLVEGNLANPVAVPANVRYFDTPFLTDIAHNADPSPQDTDHDPTTPPVAPTPDSNTSPSADFASQAPGTYDDEMLNAHFCAGDGRVNENIALTTIHQVFHSEHNRLVDDIQNTLSQPANAALLADFQNTAPTADDPAPFSYGARLFQAARFVNEMEYQHLVFEEFARKVQPAVRPFHVYSPDVNPAVQAEFAHAVYRFGHSMLNDTVARTNVDPVTGAKSDNSIPLLTAFLNPPEYFNGGSAGTLTPEQAAGSVVMGSADQVGNELDEFVTETLRNNLLGLPLDLPTLNMARARDAGVPPLNDVRRQIFARTNDAQLAPYTDWSDFGQHLKHPESLINFVAAYGTHPSITSQTTLAGKREAARAIVDPNSPAPAGTTPAPTPADAADFMFGTGAWANAGGKTTTGLDDVDLWVGGLAELTNQNGGLLGSTFNYVFQTQMENLQDGDRLYYLNRTVGMNLRTQLEGNSFSELIQRNTEGTNTLKADPFATADCKFQLGNLTFPAAAGSFITGAGSVNDDPTTACNENRLLLQKSDGTIAYRTINSVDRSGLNGQAVYNGSAGTDKVIGGIDNDTFWGGDGRDIIEGNNGDDVALGGNGNDTITDSNGADVLKGGPGNDSIDTGPGNDIFMGGDGSDFMNGGANDNESFAGPGNDFIIAGQGADAVFGDGGDDWIQGGSGQDLLQGDHGAPFFDDPAETAPGNDVFIGQVGENDYDAEGGDDIMAQNAAIDRNAGSAGFDWAIHQYDTVGADDDMNINNNLVGVPIQVVVNRDRWQETEGDSGSAFNDVIRGTDRAPNTIGGAGFAGCDVLDQAGVNRISGLNLLVPQPLTEDPAPVIAASVAGTCPLTGNTWGDGDILLGGAGSDTIEGRGADDIIDGDKALTVRISVRTDPANPATEIGTTDLMENVATSGNFGPGTAGMTLQAAVFAGLVDPGNLVVVREITSPAAGTDTASVDKAVFSGPLSNYTITKSPGKVVVSQTGANVVGQRISDGTDTLTNVEQLVFTDQTVELRITAPGAPTIVGAPTAGNGSATVSWTTPPSGGTAITSFTIVATPTTAGPAVTQTGFSGSATSGTITGLTNGTSYTLQVQAVNAIGSGPLSAASSPVTPVAPAPDTTPPTVTVRTPAAGATNVPVGNNITAQFSENVTGVTGARFTLRQGTATTGTLIARAVTYDPATTTATLNPTGNLAQNTLYTVRLTGGVILDAAGNPLAATSWSFTTAGGSAPAAPTIGTALPGVNGGAITATAAWTASAITGGSPITSFRVNALLIDAAGNVVSTTSTTAPPTATSLEVTLPAGSYRFTVQAVNAIGTSVASVRSNKVAAR